MNEITCDLCMDLIPLVKDGVASEDSRKAVEHHIASCAACRSVYGDSVPAPSVDAASSLRRFQRRLQLFMAMLMMFGIFFGISLTAGEGMFYNTIIMPLIGALGYGIFRKRALYEVPLLLFITHLAANFLGSLQGTESLDLYSMLLWTALYSAFAMTGSVVAWLLHFALRKGD